MSNVAVAVKELRETLGLTQEQLSLRAGFPGGSRVYVAKIETGRNELSTIAARERVAKGFGLTREQLDAYLEGRATLETTAAIARAEAPPPPKVQVPIYERDGYEPESPFDGALIAELDKSRHSLRDLDAVRAATAGVVKLSALHPHLALCARSWLDAAAALRKRGERVSLETLLVEVTVHGAAADT